KLVQYHQSSWDSRRAPDEHVALSIVVTYLLKQDEAWHTSGKRDGMKQLIGFLNLRRTLAALVVFGLATSGLHAERLNAWIVAEQNTPSRATTSPAPAVPSPYVLVDGGYVEEGDSVA